MSVRGLETHQLCLPQYRKVKWKCKSNVKEETLNSLLNACACGWIYAFGECAMREIIRCTEREREKASASDKRAHRISSLWALCVKKERLRRGRLCFYLKSRDKILLPFYWATAAKHEKWPGKSRNRFHWCCGELGLKAIKRRLILSTLGLKSSIPNRD